MNHEHYTIMNETVENTILKKALNQLNQIIGAKAKQLPKSKIDKGVNAEVQLTLGKEKHVFQVEIKHELRQTNMPSILNKIGNNKENWILVSRYIPQPIKNQLREQGINYLEAAGNCFIHTGSLFFYISDRPVTASRQTTTGKLWKQAGLKFLFVIISNPSLLNKPYRTIADAAGIALGSIGPLMQELQQAGYIKKEQEEWIMINKEVLIQRWVELFHVLLKPKYQLGRFRFLHTETQRQWKLIKPINFYWGGEPAGELLTNFLQPELFTIYADNNVTKLMKELQLVPDAAGSIELVEKFWNTTALEKEGLATHVVPPLLAYADLMATNDSRNWEVAARIKSKYLNG
jgi:hypothetical protein